MPSFMPTKLQTKSDASSHFNGLLFHERSYTGRDGRPMHTHDEVYLIFVLQGSVEETRKRQTFVRTPSMLTLLPAGDPHATHFCGGVRTFEIGLPSPWIERLGQYSSLVERYANYENGLPTWLALRLYREFQHQDSATPLMMEGMLLELLAQMARNQINSPEKHCPLWLRQARDFLHAHFTESLSVEAVAATVDMHPAHLIRTFRQYYGCTLGDYVRRLRVEYASHLLSASEMPLSQIALETGFADQSHFSRTFKSLTGMTPTEFQKVSGRAALKQKMLP
jgi:AraC family transcriptional regulator